MTPATAALHTWSARDLAAAIAAREVSAVEVMRAHLDRIEEVEDRVAAFVSLVPESEALALARGADDAEPPAAMRSGSSTGCRPE